MIDREHMYCPNCRSPMRLARVVPRLGALAELRTYECRPCRVVSTEAIEEGEVRPQAA